MNVVTAREKDRKNLMRLDNVCFDYTIDFKQWTDILSGEDHIRCGIIRQNLQLVGYCLYYPIFDFEDEFDEDEGGVVTFEPTCMHIWRLGIAPSYRRKSYGSVFVEHVRKQARDEQIMLVTAILAEYVVEERPWLAQFMEKNQLQFDRVETDQYEAYGRMYDGIVYEGLNAYDPKL